MASSNEISWQSAFWSLPPLAINSMMQPLGRCGFEDYDPSLRTYLRSSPIVCAFDAVTIIIRFGIYGWRGLSAPAAAKKIISARNKSIEDTEVGGIRSLEKIPFLRWLVFVLGVLPQVIKLWACSGLPWTEVWGCCYIVSFFIVEGTNILAKIHAENPAEDHHLEKRMAMCDRVCGAVAVLLQLYLLAWIDLAVIPADPILIRRWQFRFIRLSAIFVAFLIHEPFRRLVVAVQSDTTTVKAREHSLGVFVISMLLIFGILAATFEGYHFSYLYLMFSIISSFSAWFLYFIPVAKTQVLLYEPENKRTGHWNVLAFDFFCRILGLSVFWYAKHYDPTGTFKPGWTGYLG